MDLCIERTEPFTVVLKTAESIEPGALIRIKGSRNFMFRAFELMDIRVKDTAIILPVVHRFSRERMNSNWQLYGKLKQLAAFKTPCAIKAGQYIIMEMKPVKNPIAAAGVKGEWSLETIQHLLDAKGRVISGPVRVNFVSGPPDHIEVIQKPDGRLLTKRFDRNNFPVSGKCSGMKICAEKKYGSRRVKVHSSEGFESLSNALPISMQGIPVYFGDFHWHTRDNDLETTLRNARDNIGLDFAGPGEHVKESDCRVSSEQIKTCHEFNSAGLFCTLPAAEVSLRHGHIHLITENFDLLDKILGEFPGKIMPAVRSNPEKFPFEELLELCPPGRAMLRPNHPNIDSSPVVFGVDKRVYWYSFNWPLLSKNNEKVRLVELLRVNSSHETERTEDDWPATDGGFGGSVRTALGRGYRLGFTGGSDSHEGWPRANTAVQAERLDTSAIFEALYERRCYATTGARIVADATLNDMPMGSELILSPDAQRRIRICIRGTAPIAQVQIVSAGAVVADLPVKEEGLDFKGEWVDERPGRHLENIYYYVRARQKDGHRVWLSPFWIDLPG